jgi:sugar transferase (PEP-CTERM system associated)
VLIVVALFLSAWIRLGDISSVRNYFAKPYGTLRVVIVLTVCMICFFYSDLYDLQIVSRRAELLVRLLQALGAASLILALLYFLIPDLMIGRGVFAIATAVNGVLLVVWRLVVDATGKVFRTKQRVLVAGTGPTGVLLVKEILARPELNFQVVGFLDERGQNIGKSLVNPTIVGSVNDIEELVRSEAVDRVVLAFAERRGIMPLRQLLRVRIAGIPVEDASSLYERMTGRILLDQLPPSSLILSEGFRKSRIQHLIKRMVDILISVSALILLFPLMLAVGLAIYMESGGPILFRQERVGLSEKIFGILKFRSMWQDAERHGPTWAADGDHRVTKVGRILRNFRIDEIPQFVNVLRGDMSLVGPRPERPEFVTMLEEEIPYYAERHSVRPGITGWAQIKYRYGASVEDSKIKLEHDIFYVKHVSLMLDLLIILRTVQVVLFARGAV